MEKAACKSVKSTVYGTVLNGPTGAGVENPCLGAIFLERSAMRMMWECVIAPCRVALRRASLHTMTHLLLLVLLESGLGGMSSCDWALRAEERIKLVVVAALY